MTTTGLTTTGSTTTGAGTFLRKGRTRGATWLVLRRHRVAAWSALGLLAVLVGTLVWLRSGITGYTAGHDMTHPADDTLRHLSDTYGDPLHYIGRFLEFLPLLVGAFVAGPMIARELESGTYRVAWTQAISPMRWFAAKLALPAVALLAGVSVLSATYAWTWRSLPLEHLPGQWWWRNTDMLGPVPVAHALLGLAVGALAGLLVRHVLPALGATMFALQVLLLPVQWLRDRMVAPATELSREMPGLIRGNTDWIVGRGMVDASGGHLPEPDCGVGVRPADCLAQHHAVGWYLEYHPGSHMQPLLWAEAGVCTALALLVAGAAVWLMRRTHP
ncbi:hypothetical protein [Streptomyces sp. NPDC049555]|uniref:hypothetical protein n=1 Tax=Streptomyces sp. NPDC049555 TaxID=3154930 RepID=UPI0034330EEF